ncbi:MAG: hypothetical protein Q9M89_06590 [Persephonella sp.]|nr:hypothetical protein [Persephonella sp.]
MKSDKNSNFFEEISRYVRKLSGYNLTLSPKEVKILEEAFNRGIPSDIIKKLIKEEIKRYPPEKRKKFSLLFLEKKIKNLNRKKIEDRPRAEKMERSPKKTQYTRGYFKKYSRRTDRHSCRTYNHKPHLEKYT